MPPSGDVRSGYFCVTRVSTLDAVDKTGLQPFRTGEFGETIEVVREGLGGAFRIENADTVGTNRCDAEAHGHAVVIVGLDIGGCDRSRCNRHAVLELLYLLSELAELCGDGADAEVGS